MLTLFTNRHFQISVNVGIFGIHIMQLRYDVRYQTFTKFVETLISETENQPMREYHIITANQKLANFMKRESFLDLS